MIKIFVGNCSENLSSEDLRSCFAAFGRVVEADMLNGRSYGFVHMDSQHDAERAVKALDGTQLKGKRIRVEFSLTRSSRSGAASGGGVSRSRELRSSSSRDHEFTRDGGRIYESSYLPRHAVGGRRSPLSHRNSNSRSFRGSVDQRNGHSTSRLARKSSDNDRRRIVSRDHSPPSSHRRDHARYDQRSVSTIGETLLSPSSHSNDLPSLLSFDLRKSRYDAEHASDELYERRSGQKAYLRSRLRNDSLSDTTRNRGTCDVHQSLTIPVDAYREIAHSVVEPFNQNSASVTPQVEPAYRETILIPPSDIYRNNDLIRPSVDQAYRQNVITSPNVLRRTVEPSYREILSQHLNAEPFRESTVIPTDSYGQQQPSIVDPVTATYHPYSPAVYRSYSLAGSRYEDHRGSIVFQPPPVIASNLGVGQSQHVTVIEPGLVQPAKYFMTTADAPAAGNVVGHGMVVQQQPTLSISTTKDMLSHLPKETAYISNASYDGFARIGCPSSISETGYFTANTIFSIPGERNQLTVHHKRSSSPVTYYSTRTHDAYDNRSSRYRSRSPASRRSYL